MQSIRPQPHGIEWVVEWQQLPATVLGFPWGEAKRQKIYAFTIQRTTPPLRLAKSRLRRLLACIAPAGAKVSPFGLPAFSRGMIATGNHNFERFAALCNTPKGAPRALRAGRMLPAYKITKTE